MKWKKVTVHTTVEAEDLVSMMLMELGVEGVQIEDNLPLSEQDVKEMFIDILPELEPADGTSRVSFFLHEEEPEDAGIRTEGIKPGMDKDGTLDNSYMISDRIWKEEEITGLLDQVRRELEEMRAYTDIGEGRLEIGESQDTDWRDKWKEFFKPIIIDRILIIPSWLDVPAKYVKDVESGRILPVIIDPGVAFGTGNHETTRLCVPGLIKEVKKGSKVLDLGTGSGILGMAAHKLGASLVTAVDIDPACEAVLSENLELNGIPADAFRIITGNVLSDDGTAEKIMEEGPFDVAAANILAPVIAALAKAGAADRFLRAGGTFITSGILDTFEEEVLEAFRSNPSWTDVTSVPMGEWVCVTAKKV